MAAHSLLALTAALLLYPVASLLGRVPVERFARAALPAQVVAMSTRSSLAALPAMLDGADNRLHLSREISGFVLSLAVSTFRLNQVVSWLAGGLFIAKLYGLPFGVTAIVTFAVASIFMSFSVPGIPSGGVVMMTPFFAGVGLPVEGIGVLIALDVIPDLFKTLLNVTGQMTAAVVLARRE